MSTASSTPSPQFTASIVSTPLPLQPKTPLQAFFSQTVANAQGTPAHEPNSVEELEYLIDLGKRVKQFAVSDSALQDELLSNLEAYECHAQVIGLLVWRRKHRTGSREQQIQDGLRILRAHYHGMERFDEFVEFGCHLVEAQSLSNDEIRILICDGILGEDNWPEQSQFLKKVTDSVTNTADKVLLLERLALIYEKKLFLDTEVEPIYRKVIRLDPHNPKARRYFKLWYMQAMKWNDVAEHLEALVQGARNRHERQRAAHELAQLYLYNLNNPKKAREVLKSFCVDSDLDIRQTLVEALERLELYEELIEQLNAMESQAEAGEELARLKHKLGLVYLKSGKPRDAVDALRECLVHNPHHLLAFESLISALIDAGQGSQIITVLEQLKNSAQLDASKRAVETLLLKAREFLPLMKKPQAKSA
jgi:tetratricopeptide (TPR) repeat protein